MKLSNNNNQYCLRRGRDADADADTGTDTDTALCSLAFFKALSPVLITGCAVFFPLLLGTTTTILTLTAKQADLCQPLCFALQLVLVLFERLDCFAILVG